MLILSSAVMLFVAQTGSSPAKPPSAPVVQVGVFLYAPDGTTQAAAYQTNLASESVQYVAGCEIGGGNRPAPDRATDVWRVSGNVERSDAEEAVVRVDWQRLRAAGTPVTSPGGSVVLTLHVGDRVLLDSAHSDPVVGCGARTIGFEARFAARPGWTAVRGGGAGGGGGVASGTGTGGGRAGGGGRVMASPRAASDAAAFSADLWLVKTDANRSPEQPDFNMQGIVLQKVQGAAPFTFTPFTIETPAGPLSVQITGLVQVTNDRGPTELVFTAARNVRYAASGPNRESTVTSMGTSTTRHPMPGPDEVMSFELPSIKLPNSTATVPDQYSVRLRIR
jgi:hypothetical protein